MLAVKELPTTTPAPTDSRPTAAKRQAPNPTQPIHFLSLLTATLTTPLVSRQQDPLRWFKCVPFHLPRIFLFFYVSASIAFKQRSRFRHHSINGAQRRTTIDQSEQWSRREPATGQHGQPDRSARQRRSVSPHLCILCASRKYKSIDSSLNDGLPSMPIHTVKAQHHSAQVHPPPVHSSSSSSCNALVLSGESSSSSDETAADPFKMPLTKGASPADAEPTRVTLSLTSPTGDRLVRKPKALTALRTITGPPVFDTGVSLSNSSFPLRKSSREVVNLVHVRSRSLTQDAPPALVSDVARPQFAATASFDEGVGDAVERARSVSLSLTYALSFHSNLASF